MHVCWWGVGILESLVGLGWYLTQTRTFSFYQTKSYWISNLVFPFLRPIVGPLQPIFLNNLGKYPFGYDRGLAAVDPFKCSIPYRSISKMISPTFQRIKLKMLIRKMQNSFSGVDLLHSWNKLICRQLMTFYFSTSYLINVIRQFGFFFFFKLSSFFWCKKMFRNLNNS